MIPHRGVEYEMERTFYGIGRRTGNYTVVNEFEFQESEKERKELRNREKKEATCLRLKKQRKKKR